MLDKCTVDGKTYCLVRQHRSEETDDDWCLGCAGHKSKLCDALADCTDDHGGSYYIWKRHIVLKHSKENK